MRPAPIRPADAHDLAPPGLDVGLVDDLAVLVDGVVHGPVADLQGRVGARVALVPSPFGEAMVEVASDHAADDAVLGGRLGVHVEGLDGAAVADDGDRVGDRRDLAQLVRDDDRGDPLPFQLLDEADELGAVLVVECGGRFVEDQQFDLLGEGLGDLDELLFADPDVRDPGLRVLTQPDPFEEGGGVPQCLVPADEAVVGVFVAEEDVLRDGEVRHQGEFLVDDHDPACLTGADVLERTALAAESDLALVTPVRMDSAENLHQGRLTGAVLPAEGVHFALRDGQGDVRERLDAGEGLDDGPHFEDRHGHRRSLSLM